MATINHRDAAATMRAALAREEKVLAGRIPLVSAQRVADARKRADALRRALEGAK